MLADTPLNAVVPASDLDRAKRFNKGDRKSTRLNSSHSQISYAVFCLKKKKIHRHTLYQTRKAQDWMLNHGLNPDYLLFRDERPRAQSHAARSVTVPPTPAITTLTVQR